MRLQWWGPRPPFGCTTFPIDAGKLKNMVDRIQWSGRLFRDPRIPRPEAVLQTWRSIWDNPGFRYLEYRKRGFIFFGLPEGDTTRINLIGVLPEHYRKGVAKLLISLSPTPYVIAGTYEDNKAACALYDKLGWRVVKEERIFSQ